MREGNEFRVYLRLFDGLTNFRNVKFTGHAVVYDCFTTKQVDAMNSGGSFVDGMNSAVPVVLFEGVIITKP